MRGFFRGFAATGVIALAGVVASQDVVAQQSGYTYQSTTETTSGEVNDVLFSVWGDYLVMAVSENGSQVGDMRFNASRKEIIAADHNSQSFVVIDTVLILQLSGMMANMGGLMEQMRAAQSQMSEEERERMRAMGIPGFGEEEEEEASSYIGDGGTEDTEFGTCRWRQYGFPNGDVDREFCLTNQPVQGYAQAKDAFLAMADFMKALTDMASQGMPFQMGVNPEVFDDLKDMDNYPVIVRTYQDGVLDSETRLVAITENTFTDADGGPPAGYTQQQIGMP